MVNLYSEFEKSALARPDRPCVTLEGNDFSFETMLSGARRLAAKLRELAPGESESETNIGLFAPNLPGFLVGYYGTLAANKVTVPINFLLSPSEIMTIGMHAGLRIIVASGPLYDKMAEQSKGLPITLLKAEDFLEGEAPPEIPAPTRGDDDTAVLMYTSGTTGTPKGVVLSHRNIYDNCIDTSTAYNFHEKHTFVCVLPFFHSFGMTAMMIMPNILGARIVLIPQFQPQKLAEAFNTYENCCFFAVAPMFQVLGFLAKTKQIQYPNLELCVSGAAALPNDIKEAFEEATGVVIYQGYGLTEASPVVSLNLPGRHKQGSVGLPIRDVEMQIWDDEGHEVALGEVGEIMVRGRNVMKGYYKNPEETKKAISEDGWLHTGDLGRVDDDGFTTIVGRKKELIICAGENIYPLEIEDVLMTHPAVREAAVIGIPHAKKGEEPKAYVSLIEGKSVESSELRALCREKLAAFKVPAEFEVREDLPKGPTGKILKRVLEAELKS